MGDRSLGKNNYNRYAYISNFRRKSVRLPNHDYSSPGIYHVTICAKGVEGRGPLFAHPVLRKLLQTNWLDLVDRFPSIQLEEFVVMPDHIHFLIWLNKWPDRVQKQHAPYLWEIIRAYKSKVATEWIDYVEKNHPTWSARIWQDGYDEHLLRIGEINRIRRYIRENPERLYKLMNWQKPF